MTISSLSGTLKKIVFQKEDFYIAQIETDDGTSTILGELFKVAPGDELEVWGEWKNHETYGMQLKLAGFRKKTPTTIDAIEDYLASDLVKGVGKKTAEKIVAKYGKESLEICQNEPEKLTKIKGINQQKAVEIANCLKDAFEFQQILMELLPLGLTVKTAINIYKKFGNRTIVAIEENPYILTQVPQIGFQKADQIAGNLNIAADAENRLVAALEFILLEEANIKGHLYLEESDLYSLGEKLLNTRGDGVIIKKEDLKKALKRMVEEGNTIIEDNKVYHSLYHFWERESARQINSLLQTEKSYDKTVLTEEINDYQARTGILLAEKQQFAIEMVWQHKLSIITGGPGTGKTQTIRAIIDIWHKANPKSKVILAAPTGRAARRIKEVTGMEAMTIHRLLGLGHSEGAEMFFEESDNIKADLLIVDEFSMVDMQLFYQLINAIDENTTLVAIGDTDQLPSVGPGNVLQDLIKANLACVTLTEIFRQAEESQIVINAHRVNAGEEIIVDSQKEDFYFIEESRVDQLEELILRSVVKLVSTGYSLEDIQVLSPMKKTQIGIDNLNKLLQKALNPPHHHKNEIETKNQSYRVGDKVIQTVNNYEKEVFNGDVGVIFQIELEENNSQSIEVAFEDKIVKYSKDQLEELALAYAITVHKSQGSEYKVVIMPVATQHYVMLARNLLYTGITRAREKVILIGTKKALNIAVNNNKVLKRKTGFAQRIKELSESGSYSSLESI